MNIHNNPPFTLFQDSTGLFGTKDKDGHIYDEPIYKLSSDPEKPNRYISKDGLTVVDFNPEVGMELLSWCSGPWYDEAWLVADYPEAYNDILWQNINYNRELNADDIKAIKTIRQKIHLSDEQGEILEMLENYLKWQDVEFNSPLYEEFEEKILSSSACKIPPNDLIISLLPLMENNVLSPKEKSTLWYSLFCINDYLACQ